MLKNHWIRIPLKIILIWLVVTIYFYFQHPMIYRYEDANLSIPIGDAQLIIQEINITNWDEAKQDARIWKRELPWHYRLLDKMDVPVTWYGPLLRIISFYSHWDLKEDTYSWHVNGIFIYPEGSVASDTSLADENFYMCLYPGWGSGSSRQHSSVIRNADMICAHGSILPKSVNQTLILAISNQKNNQDTHLIVKPHWQKGRLLKEQNNYKSPTSAVEYFMNAVYSDHPEQALAYVLPKLKKEFPFPQKIRSLKKSGIQMESTMAWIDVFEDYTNVYQIDMEIGKPSEKNFLSQQKLSFYTIKDEAGDYKIIYWKTAENE